MSSAETRLAGFRRLLVHARERLGLDLGFVLWDGSTVPADLPGDALCIVIADEGAIAGLVRRPRLDSLVNLWVSRRIDIRGGTLFDVAAARPRQGVRTAAFLRSLDKLQLLATLARFWRLDRGGPWPLEDMPDDAVSSGDPAENKRNIGHHYDVSNAFYALWLDPEMVYSCGYCTEWDNDIEQMQLDKLEMICRKLRLKAGDRLLDIGCGWGALACYAAQNYGVTAHGVSLSEQQVAFAQEKVSRLGLEGRVQIELRDYASVQGEFDKIASVGFYEHVGSRNYTTYYETVRRVLAPGGIVLHHAITRPAKRRNKAFARKRPEFALLTKYIFPGGELDDIGNTLINLERHKFEVHDVENWREHYQRTCRHWHDRLLARYDDAVAEIGETKTRLWLLYLAGCAIAFERNTVAIYQTVSTRRRRGTSGMPPSRADLYR